MTPGEIEYSQEELLSADEALREAKLLLDADAFAGGASRLYYAAFHAARAALGVRGLHAKTHSGQITLFERTFGVAPILGKLFTLRARADYARTKFMTSAEDMREAAAGASGFIERCREIVREAAARGADEPDPPPDL